MIYHKESLASSSFEKIWRLKSCIESLAFNRPYAVKYIISLKSNGDFANDIDIYRLSVWRRY